MSHEDQHAIDPYENVHLIRITLDSFDTLGVVVNRYLGSARAFNNSEAEAYWQVVVDFCEANRIR